MVTEPFKSMAQNFGTNYLYIYKKETKFPNFKKILKTYLFKQAFNV